MTADSQAEFNPADLDRLAKLVETPAGTPHGRTQNPIPSQYHEEITPCTGLSRDMAWFFPGLLYAIIGLDRSIFAMFAEARGISLRTESHRSSDVIIKFGDSDYSGNPWCYTVQGIPKELESAFCGYVESFQFNRPNQVWSVTSKKTRIADPFVAPNRRGTDCTFLLPVLDTLGRRIVIKREAGFLLDTPILGVVDG